MAGLEEELDHVLGDGCPSCQEELTNTINERIQQISQVFLDAHDNEAVVVGTCCGLLISIAAQHAKVSTHAEDIEVAKKFLEAFGNAFSPKGKSRGH